jgi:tetratricopeptide (TPR) repeat protein
VSEATTGAERFEIYSRLYHVTAQRLSDRAGAVTYARRAYEAEPDRPDSLGLLYRACEDAGQWQQYTEALEAQLKSEAPAEGKEDKSASKQNKRGGGRKRNKSRPDSAAKSQPEQGPVERPLSEQSRRLQLSLADVYQHKLQQSEQAIATLRRLLQSAPEDLEVAELLERLLRESGHAEGLRWYYLLRAENTSEPADAIKLLHTWAELEEHTFGEPRRAAKLYGKALELLPGDARSLEKLPKLLISLGDAQAAADVIERHKEFLEPSLAARLEVELAEIYIDRLEQPELALAAALSALTALRGLGDHSGVPRAVEVLQRLVEIDSTRRKAAEALAEVYHGAQESRREADALGVLLEIEKQPARRLELLKRAMSVYEQLGSHGKAFELSLRACREFPDQLELWDQGATLSNLSGRPTELAEVYREVLRGDQLPKPIRRQLCERAAQLHEEQLGDPVGATPYLEQVLLDDPSDAEAFARLKQILTSAQRWDELRSLYDQAIQVLEGDESKVEALSEVAMVCEEFMDDSQAAMRYYEEIRKLDPRNEQALEALDRLWTAHRRYADLTQLLEKRLEIASGDNLREFRLRLASLYLDNLHQPENALRYVEDVLTDEPGNAPGRELAERLLQISALRVPASLALERVYEARDDVRDWVRVLEVRLQAISDSQTPSALLQEHPKDALLRQIAHLYNHRLRDDEGALGALLQLVPLDPESADARQELLEITARAGASAKVAEALEQAATAADSLARKGEILMQAASLYETGLNNRERAEALFQQVLNLDPADPDLVLPAAKALERIQRQSESYAAWVNTLRVRLRLEQDTEERVRLWQQIAELCEQQLRDDAAAIRAYKSLLEESPDDSAALVALDRLYERTEDCKALVEVL